MQSYLLASLSGISDFDKSSWPDGRNIWHRDDPLPLCAFHTTLDIIVAEEELHNIVPVFLIVHHETSVGWGSCGDIISNNSGRAFLLRDSLLSKASFGKGLRQPRHVLLSFVAVRFLNSCDVHGMMVPGMFVMFF